jgi:uncharacterized protein (UPF0332 family)
MGGKMRKEFNNCLSSKKITEFPRAKGLVIKELIQAESDYNSARDSFDRGIFKWSTIQSYYSMFHSARALLYARGYRERSHYCLIVAMRALYVDKGSLSHRLVESFQLGKTLRENADYYGEFSKDAAAQLLEDADQFLDAAKKLTRDV